MIGLRTLYAYRHLVLAIFLKDLRSRYVGSLLGPIWLLVQPVLLVFLYTVIFSRVMHTRLPGVTDVYAYSAFLCGGVLVWNLFVEILQRGKGVFIENANLIKKVSFPKIILFLPVVISAFFNFFLMLAVFAIFALALGIFPGTPVLLILPVALLAAVLALVLGVTTAIVNVFVRDIGGIIDSLLQFGFWMTPIVYPINILPEWAAGLLRLNPMSGLVIASQNAMLGQAIDPQGFYAPLLITLVLGVLAVRVYQKGSRVLADHL